MTDDTTQVKSEALTKVNRLAVVSIICAVIALAGTFRVGVVVIAVFAVGAGHVFASTDQCSARAWRHPRVYRLRCFVPHRHRRPVPSPIFCGRGRVVPSQPGCHMDLQEARELDSWRGTACSARLCHPRIRLWTCCIRGVATSDRVVGMASGVVLVNGLPGSGKVVVVPATRPPSCRSRTWSCECTPRG